MRVRRARGHRRDEHDIREVALHALDDPAIAVAVALCDGGGVVRLQKAHLDAFVLYGLTAVGHDALDRVSVRQAEVDDRGHVLRHHIARGAAAVDHRGRDGGGDKREEVGRAHAAGRDGVRVARNILHKSLERLLGDVGSEGFKRAGHGAVEVHGKRRARDVGDRAGETSERRAAERAARMPADAVDRELQVGVALFHQLHAADGRLRRAEGRAGLNFAAALVKNEFERHALRLQMLGDGERA